MKLYAAVSPNGDFDFHSIRLKPKAVAITRSDAKYGGLACQAVVMEVFDGELPAPASDDPFYDWNERKIAWVYQNFDGSFWLDTLSLTKAEAESWVSNPARVAAIGTKLVAVKIAVPDMAVAA